MDETSKIPTVPTRAVVEAQHSDGRPAAKAPTKLSKVAPQVFATLRAQPPEWLPEFSAWVAANLGPRPSQITRRRAAEEHDAAVLGALLAWGYFDGVIAEMAGDEEGVVTVGELTPDPDEPAQFTAPRPEDLEPPLPEEPVPNLVEVPRRPYSVLGADGEPVVQGLGSWGDR